MSNGYRLFQIAMHPAFLACIAMTQTSPFSAMRSLDHLPEFQKDKEIVTTLEPVTTEFAWNEAIVSWNVSHADGASLKIEGQAVYEDHSSRWYTLAEWAGNMHGGARRSVNDQKDDEGSVLTDTLRLQGMAKTLRLRITQRSVTDNTPELRFLGVSFTNTVGVPQDASAFKQAWGKVLDVPRRSQMPYENGHLKYNPDRVSSNFETWFKGVTSAQYCSPTSSSMVLNYWGKALGRPDLAVDVPDVVVGVFDENMPGTGNWPFNCAYMGSFVGIRSYVARLNGVSDLERLIDAGFPVICSVAYNLLQGNGKPAGGDGHLVVLVGFEANGDPIFNDPGWSEKIRQTYKRADFVKAWGKSFNTVYLAYPESKEPPKAIGPAVLSHS